MRGGKFKKIAVVIGVLLALLAAGVWVVLRLPPPVPFEVTPVSVTPPVQLDSAFRSWAGKRHGDGENWSGRVVRTTLRMRDGKDHPLLVARELVEVRLDDRWVNIPDAAFVNQDDEFNTNSVNRMVYFVVPKEATACRVEVTYFFRTSTQKLAFWLRNLWFRHWARTARTAGGQRPDLATRVFERLVPDPGELRLQTAIVEIDIANHSVATRVEESSKASSEDAPRH